jgi:hypothetical protein
MEMLVFATQARAKGDLACAAQIVGTNDGVAEQVAASERSELVLSPTDPG